MIAPDVGKVPMKVLVAEDKPAMAELLTRALHRDGHSVLVAYDGQEALEMGRSRGCDVILLDLMLPRVDGFKVIRTLRAERHYTPTLIVSARDAMNDIIQGLDSGADDYLVKPFALRACSLTRTEFALMDLLMRRAGSIVTHDTLLQAGWGFDADVSEGTLYVFIRMLRNKIGEPQFLKTARNVGYTIRQ
jgi:DNA-binding response OmpR family regulator